MSTLIQDAARVVARDAQRMLRQKVDSILEAIRDPLPRGQRHTIAALRIMLEDSTRDLRTALDLVIRRDAIISRLEGELVEERRRRRRSEAYRDSRPPSVPGVVVACTCPPYLGLGEAAPLCPSCRRRVPVFEGGPHPIDCVAPDYRARFVSGTIRWTEHVEAWNRSGAAEGNPNALTAEESAIHGFSWGTLTDLLGHQPRTWRADS